MQSSHYDTSKSEIKKCFKLVSYLDTSCLIILMILYAECARKNPHVCFVFRTKNYVLSIKFVFFSQGCPTNTLKNQTIFMLIFGDCIREI